MFVKMEFALFYTTNLQTFWQIDALFQIISTDLKSVWSSACFGYSYAKKNKKMLGVIE